MNINKITIENVRGIKKLELKDNFYPNKPIFIVAPNGYGKTSIAKAFKSIKKNKMQLDKDCIYKNNESNKPKVIISDSENNDYYADSVNNTIDSEYDIFVINNAIKPKATQHKGFNPSSSLIIEPIILWKTIPKKITLNYSVLEMRKLFNHTQKNMIINLNNNIKNIDFLIHLFNQFDSLKYLTNITSQKQILNYLEGKIKYIENEKFTKVLNEFDYLFNNLSTNDKILNTIQIIKLFQGIDEKSCFKKYCDYIIFEKKSSELISSFSSTWKNIKLHKQKKQLILDFPKANEISNGERDILVFIGKLLEATLKLKKNKSILIIDEIFDYLDDANIIAAQYQLLKIIEEFKNKNKELYLFLLTHLDPCYFKAYTINKKQIFYLNKKADIPNKYQINNLLKNRANCKKEQNDIYNLISKSYLHFSPLYKTNKQVKDYLKSIKVSKELLEPQLFYKESKNEIEKYIKCQKYNPILVCCGLRIFIEEYAYHCLISQSEKDEYLDKPKTKEKLSFVQEKYNRIPETFFILAIIYNEAFHLDSQCSQITPISHKLNNKIIKQIITEAIITCKKLDSEA
ncbi:MAG: hypothetical protein ACPKMZ_12400 [Pleomorphochaeta sp.]